MAIYSTRANGIEVKLTRGHVAVSGTVGVHAPLQLAAAARATCPGESLTLVGVPYVWPLTPVGGERQYVTRTYTRSPRVSCPTENAVSSDHFSCVHDGLIDADGTVSCAVCDYCPVCSMIHPTLPR